MRRTCDTISTMKKKDRQPCIGKVIIPAGHNNPQEPHEIDAAQILAGHFSCDVEFIVPVDDYMRKTADILMLGVEWELKIPVGSKKSTIGAQFRRASKQAKHIIIDTRRTKLEYAEIEKQVFIEMDNRKSIKKTILIDKSKKVIAIQK